MKRISKKIILGTLMLNKKIKKCPFCGSKAKLNKENLMLMGKLKHSVYSVKCTNCSCSTLMYYNYDEAIANWNNHTTQIE